jgi:serine phosphatase RsbU (regulator of sigma subunit)
MNKMYSAPDPVVLARLLAAHGVLQGAPTPEALPPLVTAALEEVPGVAEAALLLDGAGDAPAPGDSTSLLVETPSASYGRLLLTVDDAEAWVDYQTAVADFAGWLGVLLENHRQRAELQSARAGSAHLVEKQRALFVGLQEALLDVPENLSGVRFGHVYRSAADEASMGGDFYDVFETKDGGVGVVVGDVCGHGIEAVRVGTMVKDSVAAFSHQFAMPHHVLRETNRLLLEKKFDGFVTAFVGFLDPNTGVMIYSSAGHPPPVMTEDGDVTSLDSRSTPLGIFFDARYSDGRVTMKPGETMLLYTDGITEARRGDSLFGEEGLVDAMRALVAWPTDKLPALLLERALAFSDGCLGDDVALLVLRYTGPTPAAR